MEFEFSQFIVRFVNTVELNSFAFYTAKFAFIVTSLIISAYSFMIFLIEALKTLTSFIIPVFDQRK